MPRKKENDSTKVSLPITHDGRVISRKALDQPLTADEKTRLNTTYLQVIHQLKFGIQQIKKLHTYFTKVPIFAQKKIQDIKQYILNDTGNIEDINTLKMLKRHFYIKITNNNIRNIMQEMEKINNNLLKTYRGLRGKMEFCCELFWGEPNDIELSQLSNKPTYALIRMNLSDNDINAANDLEKLEMSRWHFSYYENKQLKIKNIPISSILSKNSLAWFEYFAKNRMFPKVDNQSYLMKQDVAMYHALHMKPIIHPIYIANISHTKQKNNAVGGVVYMLFRQPFYHFRQENMAEGNIYFDYRLLTINLSKAIAVLIHESMHRYAWVQDRGYYHDTKPLKHTPHQARNYPVNLITACQFFLKKMIPNEKNLEALNISTDHAYIIANNTLYFIDKIDKKVTSLTFHLQTNQLIDINEIMTKIGVHAATAEIGKILSLSDLKKITLLTGHTIKNNMMVAIDNADSYAFFITELNQLNANKCRDNKISYIDDKKCLALTHS